MMCYFVCTLFSTIKAQGAAEGNRVQECGYTRVQGEYTLRLYIQDLKISRVIAVPQWPKRISNEQQHCLMSNTSGPKSKMTDQASNVDKAGSSATMQHCKGKKCAPNVKMTWKECLQRKRRKSICKSSSIQARMRWSPALWRTQCP